MLDLRGVQRELEHPVADNEMRAGFLKRLQRHLPRRRRFVLPRRLRYRTEGTLGG